MLSVDPEDMTLEGKLEDDTLRELRAICTAGWDPNFVASPEGLYASDTVAFRRHDATVRRIIPWLAKNVDFPTSNIIDFGAGCGSSALAMSKVARFVRSFEIHGTSCSAFRRRMEIFGVNNVELTECPPETIFQRAVEAIDDETHVVLVAVVEHLLEQEQVSYLRAFWDALAPGKTLSILETPNYLAYFDTHTFKQPFAHFVRDEHFEDWVRNSPSSLRFRDGLLEVFERQGTQSALERRRRLGLGVTAEPFQQAFGCDLNEIVVADGFDEEMLKWFPLSFDDKILLATFRHYGVELPIGFAKNVLSFTFKKPVNEEEARQNKLRNATRRTGLCDALAPQID